MKTKHKKPPEKGNVALFFDVQNMARKEFEFSVDDIEQVASQYGDITVRNAFFDPYRGSRDISGGFLAFMERMTGKLVMRGYEVYLPGMRGLMTCDADGLLASRCVEEAILNRQVQYIAVVSRDGHYSGMVPIIQKHKKRFISIGTEFYDTNGHTSLNTGQDYNQPMAHSLVQYSDHCHLIEPRPGLGIDNERFRIVDSFATKSGFNSFLVRTHSN